MTNRAELFWRAVPLLIGLLILAGCTSSNEANETAASEAAAIEAAARDLAASEATASDSAASDSTDTQSQDFEQIEESVEATVNAAIALAVEATIAARDAGVTSDPVSESDAAEPDAAEPDAAEPSAEVAEQTEEPDTNATREADSVAAAESAPQQAEAPVLFTPTPDQTVAIAQYVNANTRHFLGDADATVVLVEFSDFW